MDVSKCRHWDGYLKVQLEDRIKTMTGFFGKCRKNIKLNYKIVLYYRVSFTLLRVDNLRKKLR
jgi:hypothetical protein